jgi:tetratricopeptide (TPR) repeat protein
MIQVALITCVAILFPMIAMAGQAHSDRGLRIEHCEKAWNNLISGHTEDYAFLQAQWPKEKSACAGTGIYEFHWAVILQTRGEFQQSADYLRGVIGRGLPNDKSLRVLYLSTRFSEDEREDKTDIKRLRAVNRRLEHFVVKYPRDSYILTEQARELLVLQEYRESFRVAKEAADLDASDVPARMWLVISAARIHSCRIAQPYIVPAIVLWRRLLANRDYMYAAASCYLDLGSIATAKNVLLSLAQRDPSVRLDPVYKRLAKMVLAAEQRK